MIRKGQKLTLTTAKLAANRKNALMRSRPGSLMRQLMYHYQQSAVRRTIPFSLTEVEFEILVQGDCFYCGQKPARKYRPTRYKECYLSNGIDRVDNTLGYELANCVPCCKVCNQFKSDLTQQQMFEIVERIYERHVRSV
jgi:hypothetical protein